MADTGFTIPTMQELIDRISADFNTKYPGEESRIKNSLLWILARVYAGAIYPLYLFQRWALNQRFTGTCTSDYYADRLLEMYGLFRLPATTAAGKLNLTGLNSTVIPVGFQWTIGNIIYSSTESKTISGGVATIAVECDESGDAGNQDAGTEGVYLSPLAGLDATCTVESGGITGGVDEEDTPTAMIRLAAYLANTPQGGAAADYESWAMATEDVRVDRVWVQPEIPMPGYVTIYFTEVDTGSGYIPGESSADNLLCNTVNTSYCMISKSNLSAAIGYTVHPGDLAGGTIYFQANGTAEPKFATINSSGAISVSAYWRFNFETTLDAAPALAEPVGVYGPECSAVKNAVLENSPVTARVIVKAPAANTIDIDVSIKLFDSAVQADVEDDVAAQIDSLFRLVSEIGGTVYNSEIVGAINSAAGIKYFSITDVDGGGASADVVCAAGQLPVLGTLSITWL